MAAAAMAAAAMEVATGVAVTEVVVLAAEMAAAMVAAAKAGVETEAVTAEEATVVAARAVETVEAAKAVAMAEPRSPHLRNSVLRASRPPSRKNNSRHYRPALRRERPQLPRGRILPRPRPAPRRVHIRSFDSPSAQVECRAARRTGDTGLQLHSTSPHASTHPCPRSSCRRRHRPDQKSTQAVSSGRAMAAGRESVEAMEGAMEAAMEAEEMAEAEMEEAMVVAVTEVAVAVAVKEVAMEAVAKAEEESVVATAVEAMGVGVRGVVTVEAAKAVVMAASQWPHQRSNALRVAHKLLRIGRSCDCCPSPQYAD